MSELLELAARVSGPQQRILEGYFDPPGFISSASESLMRKGLIELRSRRWDWSLTPLGHKVARALSALGGRSQGGVE